MLSLDWNLVFTIINLLLLYLLLKKFLFKPVCEMMDKREKLIHDQMAEAEAEKAEAMKLKADYEETLKNARQEAAKITDAARARAGKEYDVLMANARAESAKLMADAEKTIENERVKVLDGAKYEIADLALLAAAKVISKNADGVDNRQLAESFISEAGEQE